MMSADQCALSVRLGCTRSMATSFCRRSNSVPAQSSSSYTSSLSAYLTKHAVGGSSVKRDASADPFLVIFIQGGSSAEAALCSGRTTAMPPPFPFKLTPERAALEELAVEGDVLPLRACCSWFRFFRYEYRTSCGSARVVRSRQNRTCWAPPSASCADGSSFRSACCKAAHGSQAVSSRPTRQATHGKVHRSRCHSRPCAVTGAADAGASATTRTLSLCGRELRAAASPNVLQA